MCMLHIVPCCARVMVLEESVGTRTAVDCVYWSFHLLCSDVDILMQH